MRRTWSVLLVGATADVQEISGLAAVQVDDVESRLKTTKKR
jgi:hypothetical protein